ncbi:hypothetical protein HAX54_032908 [Datura stramonium]|uniref:Uncharacterized protein n=1 Tax=Datura stramonium TaxID=4076 RepID=A0ABS8SD07_DATST|nr:hypothetical protein [Datura stramonium]
MEKNSRDGLLLRSAHHQKENKSAVTTSSDFVLQWGNRKRLRCMKVQNKNINNNNNNDSADSVAVQRAPVRVDRRVVRSDLNKDSGNQPATTNSAAGASSNGYLNLRQRAASPSHRILRNSENSIAMRERSNGLRGMASLDKVGAHDKRGSAHVNHHQNAKTNNDDANNHHHHGAGGGSASSETAADSKKGGGGGGSSSGSDAVPMVWPPKFVIGLTNKEKEEDFMAIKGSKLPQRPKKRAKFIQRTLNLISPGAWLCDLSLERYEVREKKVSKKRPRGLKAMGNMESDSE